MAGAISLNATEPDWLRLINQFLAEHNTDSEWGHVRCANLYVGDPLIALDDPGRSTYQIRLGATPQPSEPGWDMDIVIDFVEAEVEICLTCSKMSVHPDEAFSSIPIPRDWLERLMAVPWPA